MRSQEFEIKKIAKRLKELSSPHDKLEYLRNRESEITQELYMDAGSIFGSLLDVMDTVLAYIRKEMEHINCDLKSQKKIESLPPEPVKGEKIKRLSHSQQMILLDKFGILEHLDTFNITKENKAYLISLIIGKNQQNTREYLTYGTSNPNKTNPMKQKYIYRTQENIEFANKIRSKLNLV